MAESPKSSKLISKDFHWLRTGDQALTEMISAISAAQESVRLEMYIFTPGPIADKFRSALVGACQRGLQVWLLIDALGSLGLPDNFWDVFRTSGGQFRWFNPLTVRRLGLRDHRKLLVCDDAIAFIGGFNIATEYTGDGITQGWRDLGLRLSGNALVRELSRAFDDMFALADFKHPFLSRLRKAPGKKVVAQNGQLLLGAPGRTSELKKSLQADLERASDVCIMSAYFLPTWRLRRALGQVVRRGGRVRLILAGKSDVQLSQLAARSLYRRFLRSGVEIYEYQPQIFHAKLVILDQVVYVGSANLDTRSLQINYELLVRLDHATLAAEAREIFQSDIPHCQRIDLNAWRRSRSLWEKLKQRWAYFLLARVDPFLTRKQLDLLR